MANYEYKWKGNKGKIVEKSTGYVLCLTNNKKKSIMMTNWLNAGAAFNGFTPSFFIDKSIQER